MLDEKLATMDEYRYDGVRNGLRWKVKLTNHIISRVPILKEILDWAESQDLQPIDRSLFREATHGHLTDEQRMTVQASVWGFLAACLSGSAETHFMRAPQLNGLDAWRIVTRMVNHRRSIHLEALQGLGQRGRH